MYETIEVIHHGEPITITIATTKDSHSYFSEHPEAFLKLKQDVKNVLRNVEIVVVK